MNPGRKALFGIIGLAFLPFIFLSVASAAAPVPEGEGITDIGGSVGGTAPDPGKVSCKWALIKCLPSGSCNSGYESTLKCEGKSESDCKNNSTPQDCVAVSTNPASTNPPLSTNPSDSTNPGGISLKNPLNFTNLSDLLTAIAKFLFTISVPIVTIMVLFGGFQVLTAAGNAQQIDAGKRTLLYAVIGFVIILLAGGIASLVGSVLSGNTGGTTQTQPGENQSSCPTGFTGTPPNCEPAGHGIGPQAD